MIKVFKCKLCQRMVAAMLPQNELPTGWAFHHESTETNPVYLCDRCSAQQGQGFVWRICVRCHVIDQSKTDARPFCLHCLAEGHNFRMLSASEFEPSRDAWRLHPWPEVVETAMAAIDAAEQALAAAIENLEGEPAR